MKSLAETLQPSRNDLRCFAGLQFIFFLAIFVFLLRQPWSATVPAFVLAISALLAMIGLLSPLHIRAFYIVWMLAVFPIGWAVSHLLMAIVYYLVVTPIGFWRRRTSGDPLQRNFDQQTQSYWEETLPNRPPDSYFRQF